jgi:hypothetical protein
MKEDSWWSKEVKYGLKDFNRYAGCVVRSGLPASVSRSQIKRNRIIAKHKNSQEIILVEVVCHSTVNGLRTSL